MTEHGMVEKVVENKFLLLFQRIGIYLITLAMPILLGYLFGLGSTVAALQSDIAGMKIRDNLVTERRDDDFASIRDDLGQLSAVVSANADKQNQQNTLILQSIARLEATINRQ